MTASKTSILDMRRTDLKLLREIIRKVPVETTLEDDEFHQCCAFFKYHILRTQEQAIPKVFVESQSSRANSSLAVPGSSHRA